MWHPEEHCDEDNLRWCKLRAVEWGVLPSFLAQAVVPVLLLEWPLWKILLGVLLADVLWAAVRYRFVSVATSYLASAFVSVAKLPVTFSMVIYFVCRHEGWSAALCVGWFFASGVTGLFPVKVGGIQKMLMAKLGYGRPVADEGAELQVSRRVVMPWLGPLG